MTNNKLRIHIKNNHASSGTFPPTIESEEVFTITEERFGDACERFPAVAEQVEAFIDWDSGAFRQINGNRRCSCHMGFPDHKPRQSRTTIETDSYYRRRSRASLPDELGSGRCKSGQQPWSSRRERRGVRL